MILLWQAATTCQRLPIVQAIEESGLEVFVVVTGDKGRPQLGNVGHSYALCTEMLYVIARKGDPIQ